jgi:hypothetical protein
MHLMQLGLLGDQPELDSFGGNLALIVQKYLFFQYESTNTDTLNAAAGGAGGHAPFGLPKGTQFTLILFCTGAEVQILTPEGLSGAKPLPYECTMADTTYMVPPPGEIAK